MPRDVRMIIILLVALVLPGCSRKAKTAGSPAPSSTPPPRSLAAGSIPINRSAKRNQLQSSPDYLRAGKLFAQRDYRGTLAILHRLSSAATAQVDKDYLNRQIILCQYAIDGKVIKKTASVAPPRPRTPEQANCGARALAFVCAKLNVAASVPELQSLAGTTGYGATMEGLQRAAAAKGLKAEGVQVDLDALKRLDKQAIAWVDGEHYVAVLSVDGDNATIRDPNENAEERIATEELFRRSGGILLTIELNGRGSGAVTKPVIPVPARHSRGNGNPGTHLNAHGVGVWIPACAGMTGEGPVVH